MVSKGCCFSPPNSISLQLVSMRNRRLTRERCRSQTQTFRTAVLCWLRTAAPGTGKILVWLHTLPAPPCAKAGRVRFMVSAAPVPQQAQTLPELDLAVHQGRATRLPEHPGKPSLWLSPHRSTVTGFVATRPGAGPGTLSWGRAEPRELGRGGAGVGLGRRPDAGCQQRGSLLLGPCRHRQAQPNPLGLQGGFDTSPAVRDHVYSLLLMRWASLILNSIWFPLEEFSVRKLSSHNFQRREPPPQQQIPFFSARSWQRFPFAFLQANAFTGTQTSNSALWSVNTHGLLSLGELPKRSWKRPAALAEPIRFPTNRAAWSVPVPPRNSELRHQETEEKSSSCLPQRGSNSRRAGRCIYTHALKCN